jgi:hypothetical protein
MTSPKIDEGHDIATWNMVDAPPFVPPPRFRGIEPRLLLPLLRVHLYRFAADELSDVDLVWRECDRLAARLEGLGRQVPEIFAVPPTGMVELRRSRIWPVPSSLANELHLTSHYLGSPRPDGLHLGLCSASQRGLLALATLSPFDLSHLTGTLPPGVRSVEVLVLSRILTAAWSPRNTGSFFLGRMIRWLRRRHREVRALLSYLDPNAGFRGSLYRSANWILLARERKRRYLYLDENYVTDRQMLRTYGTADFAKLKPELQGRISCSVWPLQPLNVFAFFLDTRLRRQVSQGCVCDFDPPNCLVGDPQQQVEPSPGPLLRICDLLDTLGE